MLNRRGFLVVLGATFFAVPGSLAEQNSRSVPRIGWLVPTTQAEWEQPPG